MHTQWASSVNECYSVIYDTTSFQREGAKKREKKNKEVKNASCTRVTVSAAVSEVTLLTRTFFTLSWCVYSAMSWSPFTLLPCLLFSGVKYLSGFNIPLRLARGQQLFVFGAPRVKRSHVRTAVDKPMKRGLELAVNGHTWALCLELVGSSL